MDKYPMGSKMGDALDRFWNTTGGEYRRSNPEHPWQVIHEHCNKILYREHRAYMAPSDAKFVYITFEAEQDKTAFLLKWI